MTESTESTIYSTESTIYSTKSMTESTESTMRWIDDLKSRIHLLDVVKRYVKINKFINNKAVIKCPFHDDKTPSCHIGNNNLFYCFGCHAGGDAIKFVQQIENISFIEAAHKIANIYNFEIPKQKNSSQVNQYFDTLEKIVRWCCDNLYQPLHCKSLNYLYRRGFNDDIIKDFCVGWMPDYSSMQQFFYDNHISNDLLSNVGLTSGILYMMQNRIIFPIYKNGAVVAISGRYIDAIQNQPKYINTSETQYFKKKEILYTHPKFHTHHRLQDDLKPNSSEATNNIYFVEGYMDVCMLHAVGLKAAACMGTACSVQHIISLWNYADNVHIMLDADTAGKASSNALAINLIESVIPGKTASFIALPNNMDPADVAQKGINIANLPMQNLAEKIWSIYDPKICLNPEHKVRNYKYILSMSQKIKDYDLRNLYKKFWKEMWYTKAPHQQKQIKSQIIYHDHNIQNKQILIMLSMLYHYPDLIEYTYDYLASLQLKDDHVLIQTCIMSYYDNIIIRQNCVNNDFHEHKHDAISNISKNKMNHHQEYIQYVSSALSEDILSNLSMQSLQKYAPFIKNNTAFNELLDIWFQIFDFYLKTVCNDDI